MPLPRSWTAEAFNPVPESENRIHSDEIARAYGFRGALVPGVVVSAYLIHPAAEVWGRAWLEVGRASVVVHSPVYDGENFQLEIETASENAYEAVLVDERGVRCATAQVSLPEEISDPPSRRGDALLARDAERPVASRAVMERLRDTGLGAISARWSEGAEITSYLRRSSEMAPVFRDEGLANPGFILGLTNWVLGRNVRMSPWLHLQTDSQHHRPVAPDTELVVEAAISDLFEKKGHEFVDVEVGVYQRSDDVAVASVRLRAIYLLRQP
ncbi:MAG: hypothetical protein JRE71_12390 [Deltaproteobacteria bacterium]|nr:hypothetical protein [Deltaproteobacteria bacterium]